MNKFYLYLEPLVTNRGVLVGSRMECMGSEVYYDASSIDDCAIKCEGIAEMFIFGTNDFGYSDKCFDNGLCNCYCETSSSYDGTCQQKSHNGYRLFKYKDLGDNNLVTFSKNK